MYKAVCACTMLAKDINNLYFRDNKENKENKCTRFYWLFLRNSIDKIEWE